MNGVDSSNGQVLPLMYYFFPFQFQNNLRWKELWKHLARRIDRDACNMFDQTTNKCLFLEQLSAYLHALFRPAACIPQRARRCHDSHTPRPWCLFSRAVTSVKCLWIPMKGGFHATVVNSSRDENKERVNSSTAQLHHRVPHANGTVRMDAATRFLQTATTSWRLVVGGWHRNCGKTQ